MIVITLAGNSSRFTSVGIKTVKYLLPFSSTNVLDNILRYIPRKEKLLIVLNKKHNTHVEVQDIVCNLNFIDYLIIEISDTKGQLETVSIGLSEAGEFCKLEDELVVFNGDTIRKSDKWTNFFGEVFVEVNRFSGDHWSFVDQLGRVSRVTEKERISVFCSNGLYAFKSINFFVEESNKYMANFNLNTELYIAPFINELLCKGYEVQSSEIDNSLIQLCGTPIEYYQSYKNEG